MEGQRELFLRKKRAKVGFWTRSCGRRGGPGEPWNSKRTRVRLPPICGRQLPSVLAQTNFSVRPDSCSLITHSIFVRSLEHTPSSKKARIKREETLLSSLGPTSINHAYPMHELTHSPHSPSFVSTYKLLAFHFDARLQPSFSSPLNAQVGPQCKPSPCMLLLARRTLSRCISPRTTMNHNLKETVDPNSKCSGEDQDRWRKTPFKERRETMQ